MAADGTAPIATNVCFTMHGIGVSGGIAIGHAHLFHGMSTEVDHYEIPNHDVGREQRRYDRAVKEVRDELKELADSVRHSAASELAPFVNVHLMLLEDAAFSEAPREIIREKKCNAEWALRVQLDELVAQFDDIQDEYLREREADVRQVAERVLGALAGSKRRLAIKPTRQDADMILVARDLSPADVILFREHPFAAFVTDMGGATSHTAIIARSLAIPAIVALHHARTLIREDELLIVDGKQGVIIVNPDRTVLAEYRLRQNQARLEREKLKRLKSAPTATLDGTAVQLYANIELPSDLEAVRASGAGGIGLYRSEFLFMNRRDLPDEDEQYEAYREVVEGMKGRPVTIRTLDLGADKAYEGQENEAENPALGLRAIRFCLAEPQIFNTQLRAILRASRHGKAMILIPMLSSYVEIHQAVAAVGAREGGAEDRGRQVRRFRARGRHDRDSRRGHRASDVHPQARLPLDRHQRSHPVHPRDRPRGRYRRPPLRPPSPGGAVPHRKRDSHRAPAREAGGRVRRDGGRRRPHPPAARLRPAQFLHAPGLDTRGEAARALDEPAGHRAGGGARDEGRRAREARRPHREAERLARLRTAPVCANRRGGGAAGPLATARASG